MQILQLKHNVFQKISHTLGCISYHVQIQSTLGFETLDKAAALGLETATPLTDPRQYINSNLGFRNLKI